MRRAGSSTDLRRNNFVKVKGLNVVPKASDSGWGAMWSNFDWTGWLKPQLDIAKAQGANCVKVTGSGATVSYPASATFLANIKQFLDYATGTLRLRVYWNYASTDWGGTLAAAATALDALVPVLNKYPQVIAIDAANEVGTPVGGDSEASLANAESLITMVKARTTKPVTASLYCPSAANYTDSTAQAIAGYADFMDFHPYYTTGDPANSDFATYRAQSWYKPFLLGEGGSPVSAGSTAQTSRWTAMGDISAAAKDCFGAVGFCVTDYDATAQYGMYAADLVTARSQITTPFAAWVAR